MSWRMVSTWRINYIDCVASNANYITTVDPHHVGLCKKFSPKKEMDREKKLAK